MKLKCQRFVDWFGKQYTAYLLWLLGVICFQSGFIYCNENNMGSFESILSRAIACLIFNYVWVIYQDKPAFPDIHFKNLTIRNIILSLYGYAFAECQFYLPLPIVHTIFISGPLFIYIMDYFVNNIIVSNRQLTGVIIASIGVIITINAPLFTSMFFNEELSTTFTNYKSTNPFVRVLAGCLLIVATIGWSYGQIIAKKVKGSTHYQSNYHLGIIMVAISGLLYVYKPQNAHTDYKVFLISLVVSGIPLALCNMFLILALGLTNKTGNVTMIGFLSIIFSYVLSLLRYHQQLNIFSMIGALGVAMGVYRIVKK